jgi:hypothetical protein
MRTKTGARLCIFLAGTILLPSCPGSEVAGTSPAIVALEAPPASSLADVWDATASPEPPAASPEPGPEEAPDAAPLDEVCAPDCTGKECGPDGCGGSCGSCGPGGLCGSGQCVSPAPVGSVIVDATVLDPPAYNGCCGLLDIEPTPATPAFHLEVWHDLDKPGNDNCEDGPYTATSGKAIQHMIFHPGDIIIKEGHGAGPVKQVTLDWGENVAVDSYVPGQDDWTVQILMDDGTLYQGHFTGVWCRACLPTWDHMGGFKITEVIPPKQAD